MTAPITATPSPTPAWVRAARALGGELAWYAVMWVAVCVGLGALFLGVAAWRGEVTTSTWAGAVQLPRYAFLAGGLVMVTSHLCVYLAHGISRRASLRAGALVGTVLALVGAGAAVVVLGVERLVYRAAGWPHVLGRDEERIYTDLDQFGLVLVEMAGVFAAYLVTGWLIGAGFMRLGWVGGVAFLPVALVPAVGAEALLGAGGLGWFLADRLDLARPALAGAVAVTVVLVAGGSLGAGAMLRRLPLAPGDVSPWR